MVIEEEDFQVIEDCDIIKQTFFYQRNVLLTCDVMRLTSSMWIEWDKN